MIGIQMQYFREAEMFRCLLKKQDFKQTQFEIN